MKKDTSCINSSPDLLISASKTSNTYKVTTEQYEKLLKENVTKTCKKSTEPFEKSINLEPKNRAKKLDLVEKVRCLALTCLIVVQPLQILQGGFFTG